MFWFFVISGLSEVSYAYTGTEMTISGTGNVTRDAVATYPYTKLTKITILEGITGIGYNAFFGCSSLTTIILPSSLEYLDGAFSTTRLTTLTLPKKVKYVNTVYLIYSCMTITEFIVDSENQYFTTYDGCLYSKNLTYLCCVPTAKTSISFAPSLTEIGQWAFTKMTLSISMPDSLTTFHNSVFIDCTIKQIDFTVNSKLTSIPTSCFHQTNFQCGFVMPPKVASIGATAFWQTNIPSFSYIGTSVLKSIGIQSFLNSKYLTSVDLPASLQSIDNTAFQGCPNIATFTIPNSDYFVTSNGYVFNKAMTQLVFVSPSAETLDIPSTVSQICVSTLQRCTKVKTINMNGNTNLGEKEKVIYQNSFTVAAFAVGSVTDVTIHDSATSIAKSLFQGIQSLTSCSFGNSQIKTIDEYTFYNCTNLKTITLPSVLVTTGSYCFSNSGITSITLPSTYNYMNFYFCAFCKELKSVTIHQDAPITQITSKSFYACYNLTEVTFNKNLKEILGEVFFQCSIKNLQLPAELLSIGANSFQSNGQLTSITFNDKLQTISGYAFYDCPKLTSITLPNNLQSLEALSFGLCTSLETVAFNGNTALKTLGGLIFQGCTSIKTFQVPAGVTTFEPTAFYQCKSLSSFTSLSSAYTAEDGILYKGTVLAVCPCAAGDVVVRPGTTEIGANSFYGGSGVTSVDFGQDSSVSKIGVQTFYECTALAALSIPPSVKIIESGAFTGCIKLASIQFGANSLLESIGSSTFSGCEVLAEVIFNGDCNLATIGSSTFENCKMLSKIVIPNGVSSIGSSAFKGCVKLTECLLGSLTSLSEISASCFEGCSTLMTVTIPESITTIGSKAFYKCGQLNAMVLPPGLKTIDLMAFSETSIEALTIPKDITSVGEMAFSSNARLSTIYYCGMSDFSNTVFSSCSNISNVYLMAEYPESTFCGLPAQRVMGTCMKLPTSVFTIGEINRPDSMLSLLVSAVLEYTENDS